VRPSVKRREITIVKYMKTLMAVALASLALVPKVPAGDRGGGSGGVAAARTNDIETSRILAGDLGGIGVVVVDRRIANDPLRIENVVSGSPAERAGIKPHCFLISVDGTNVVSMSLTRSRSMLLGPIGTSVTLDLADSQMNQTNRFTAKRGKMVFSKRKVEVIDK
jgi:C-terminal processing protease CtpA/Prc